jgi:two-component system, LytTR family, response regulator
MIRVVLIDDEKASLLALGAKLADVETEVKLLATFQNPVEALAQIQKLEPDVVFLDVDMPEMDGFAFLNNLPQRNFEVIFTTAFSQYLLDALRKEAFDFLVKPILQDDLNDALIRIAGKLKAKADFKKQQNSSKIGLPTGKGLQFVAKEELMYVTAEKNYTIFHVQNGQDLVVSKTMKEFEELLENAGFFRIHHATMVNFTHIREYIKGEGGIVIMSNGTELEVARRRKQDFMDAMNL